MHPSEITAIVAKPVLAIAQELHTYKRERVSPETMWRSLPTSAASALEQALASLAARSLVGQESDMNVTPTITSHVGWFTLGVMDSRQGLSRMKP